MASLRPVCDRHTNLQMIQCSLKRTTGSSQGHICPVPGCGRHYDDEGYFDVVKTKAQLEESGPKNRQDAARAAILKALRPSQNTHW
jgi:hypothetical protein